MMNECFGKKFILNGDLQPSDLFNNSLVFEGESVYEVIRMSKGTPVFFHDHIDRLYGSVKYQKKELLADIEVLRKAILDLTITGMSKDINLKIVFNYNNGVNNWLVYFIEPMYPSAEQYRKGVKGILFRAERKDPESKVINHELRSEIYHRLILEGAYEALLVNEKNQVTEGSRSNIFFVKGKILYTAPDNLILNGITRKHILDICANQNIPVEMKCVRDKDIAEYDSVFMTGTSPTVLPFCCIEDILFDAELALMEQLREFYLTMAEKSLIRFRKE
jgi:branched-chain amino acid aminotransferase